MPGRSVCLVTLSLSEAGPGRFGGHLSFTDLCHTMGVLPSTQPVATRGSSFILSSFDMACTCCVPVGRCCSPYHTILGPFVRQTVGENFNVNLPPYFV